MSGRQTKAQGNKTHEQQLRTFERKDDLVKEGETDMTAGAGATADASPDADARQSEFSVSRGGMHQESRDHNKHNHGGQSGHKQQKHSPAEEKH